MKLIYSHILLLAATASALSVKLGFASPNCDTFKSCVDCTTAKSWTGSHCRWCPITNDCHAEGSLANKCDRSHQITNRDACPDASALPSQVHLAFGDADSNGDVSGMTVSWATPKKTATSTVKYGTVADALTQVATGESVSYLEGGMVHNHVLVKGLKPGATYFYSCGDSAGGFTAPQSFTLPLSAAAAGAPGAPEMKVSIFGDWGYGENGHAVSTRRALETLKSQVDFFFHLGDISYADDAFLHDVTGFGYENVYSELNATCFLVEATQG